jgi:hypothetical protein
MRFLDKLIIYTTIFALFSEDFYFQYGIQWKLFYLIITLNFLLLIVKNKIVVHKNMLFVFAFFIVHGLIFYAYFKNPFTSLLSQLLGIGISSIYFYSFLKNYSTTLVFRVYLKFSFILAVLAIPMFFFKVNSFDSTRLNGIMAEPAHYAAIMLPALYFFLKEGKKIKFFIVLITILLSQSSLGYIGILLILILPLIKIKYAFKYVIVILTMVFLSIYFIKSNWENENMNNITGKIVTRIKQTYESINGIETGKFEENVNLSSYAIISNFFITRQNVLEHPLGSGLGSYRHQYDFYYEKMAPPNYLIKLELDKINREDANSLLLRFTSDLGLFALLFFVFIFYLGIRIMKSNDFIRQGAFFYLLLKIIREGHYFPPEFYFFLIIFLKDFNEDIAHS